MDTAVGTIDATPLGAVAPRTRGYATFAWATLAANLQPFVAAVFAVILLDERITAMQIAGGALIAAGILLARRRVRSEA